MREVTAKDIIDFCLSNLTEAELVEQYGRIIFYPELAPVGYGSDIFFPFEYRKEFLEEIEEDC